MFVLLESFLEVNWIDRCSIYTIESIEKKGEAREGGCVIFGGVRYGDWLWRTIIDFMMLFENAHVISFVLCPHQMTYFLWRKHASNEWCCDVLARSFSLWLVIWCCGVREVTLRFKSVLSLSFFLFVLFSRAQ